jgi:hypothetical protein
MRVISSGKNLFYFPAFEIFRSCRTASGVDGRQLVAKDKKREIVMLFLKICRLFVFKICKSSSPG